MKQKSGIPTKPHNWLILATLGLGFCLASTEYERYTALWLFDTRYLPELILILLSLIAVLGFFIYRIRRNSPPLYTNTTLLVLLAVLQSFGLAGRLIQELGYTLPFLVDIVASATMQSAGILFILFAEFFLEIGIKKTVRSFAFGVLIAGFLQIIVLQFSLIPAVCILFFFMPVACLLLVLATRLRSETTQQQEKEDVKAELANTENYDQNFPFWEFCVNIFFLSVLMIALHTQAMSLQDSGEGSKLIQFSSGFGGVVAGVVLIALLRYLQESEILELFRLIALPIMFVALYVSALFGASGALLYIVFLNISYAAVLLFVWTAPRYYRNMPHSFIYACIAYFFYRFGWATGIIGIMIIPQHYAALFETALILVSFLVLLVLNSLRLIKFRRTSLGRAKAPSPSDELVANSDIAFLGACERISTRFGLTPREGEVLALLARGRNAKYIADALVVSDGTARTHIMHIYQKMNLNSQQVLMDVVDEELDRS